MFDKMVFIKTEGDPHALGVFDSENGDWEIFTDQ